MLACADRFDLIFLDPPFADKLFDRALAAATPLLAEGGLIYVESPGDIPPPAGFTAWRQGRAGATVPFDALKDFDPITLGHEDLMRRAAGMFERLVLAVAVGHHKKTLFSLDERLEMAQEVAAQIGNVEVIAFDGLLRDFVRTHA
eukprot:gene21655-26532_t